MHGLLVISVLCGSEVAITFGNPSLVIVFSLTLASFKGETSICTIKL